MYRNEEERRASVLNNKHEQMSCLNGPPSTNACIVQLCTMSPLSSEGKNTSTTIDPPDGSKEYRN